MSRTYKDRPYEVRAKDSKREFIYESHDHRRLGYSPTMSFRGILIEYPTECPIDNMITGRYLNADGILCQQAKTCTHELLFTHWNYRRPSKDEIRNSFWAPMRTAEKNYLKKAVQSYNTYSEVDEDFFLQEKTHHACYGGGWWD